MIILVVPASNFEYVEIVYHSDFQNPNRIYIVNVTLFQVHKLHVIKSP